MAVELLDDIMRRLDALPPDKLMELNKRKEARKLAFIPNPGPQTDAYLSKADILLYGGQGGGGKSALSLGLALTAHKRSLIMRRKYTDLGALIEEALRFNGGRDGFNGSSPPKLRTRDGRLIEFGAAAHIGDEQSWQGQPHDLLAIDEATQFAESQIRFLCGWVRTTEPGQRTRVILATNPPVSATGEWIVGMFRPWLDVTHPRPARPGELRWFVTDAEGKDLEVDGPAQTEIDGRMVTPLSRTFIPASVSDNPFLAKSNYVAQLDALQEPWRSAVRDGNFMAARADDLKQVIPAEWVRQAQKRWTPRPPDNIPMTALAIDVAQGGADHTCIAMRHDHWFAPLISVPGKDTPTPSSAAALVVAHRRSAAGVIVDVGGGYGGGVVENLRTNGIQVLAFNGANSGIGRTKDRMLAFVNKRAEAWWRLREALDPDQVNGSPISLPDDPILMGDLTAPTFDITTRGIKIEAKEDVKGRIGRSPDRGDAVVMAWSEGQVAVKRGLVGLTAGQSKERPKAVVGYAHLKHRRR